jgi:hypothetical protein
MLDGTELLLDKTQIDIGWKLGESPMKVEWMLTMTSAERRLHWWATWRPAMWRPTT